MELPPTVTDFVINLQGTNLYKTVKIVAILAECDQAFKDTMSHLKAPKNEKVKFQLHLKNNAHLERP